jgi:dihydrofolate reductase
MNPLPQFSIIAAMTRERVIGANNTMPWKISADLKRFKALTVGHRVVMGRKTFDSIGRALPNRENVVVSAAPRNDASVTWVGSLEEALKIPATQNQKIFVIGGGQLYTQALANFAPQVERMYLTVIEHPFLGDAYFPEFDWKDWQVEHEQSVSQSGDPPFTYRFFDLVPAGVSVAA